VVLLFRGFFLERGSHSYDRLNTGCGRRQGKWRKNDGNEAEKEIPLSGIKGSEEIGIFGRGGELGALRRK